MPTYEYVCAKCNHEFEKSQPISEAALTVCPKELCALKSWGKGKVKRRISGGAGLLFKGSGFYTTDYRSEGYKAAAKKEGESSKPAETTKSEKTSGGDSAAKTSSSASTSTPSKPTASKTDKE